MFNSDKAWNDEAREALKNSIRSMILGEIRLSKLEPEEILENCREVHIEESCPESERDEFIRFSAEELSRAQKRHAAEQADWPEQTGCDRLDRVEATLRDRAILFWQASPCCDTCSVGELPARIKMIDARHPGFCDRVRGYAFFIEQNMPESLAATTRLSVYFAYGWFSPDRKDVPPDEYEKHALAIAREVCAALRDEGFEVDWDGNFTSKFGISLDWRRRTALK